MVVTPDTWDADYSIVIVIGHDWGGSVTVSEVSHATIMHQAEMPAADGVRLGFVLSPADPDAAEQSFTRTNQSLRQVKDAECCLTLVPYQHSYSYCRSRRTGTHAACWRR